MAWLSILGSADHGLESSLVKRVEKRITDQAYAQKDILYMQQHRLGVLEGKLVADDKVMEGLRAMAQASQINLSPPVLTSHRRFIGPFIVVTKKIVFRLLQALLKSHLQKQIDYNARTLEVLIRMHKDYD
jgi:hypothetical protein